MRICDRASVYAGCKRNLFFFLFSFFRFLFLSFLFLAFRFPRRRCRLNHRATRHAISARRAKCTRNDTRSAKIRHDVVFPPFPPSDPRPFCERARGESAQTSDCICPLGEKSPLHLPFVFSTYSFTKSRQTRYYEYVRNNFGLGSIPY